MRTLPSFCSMEDLAALGFPADCGLAQAETAGEAQCSALPVTTPAEFANCIACWLAMLVSADLAQIDAHRATMWCQGPVDATSTRCASLGCTTPLPDQDYFSSHQDDCHRGIENAGVAYLTKLRKTLEQCALAGGTRASCLADGRVLNRIQRADATKAAVIGKMCRDQIPAPSPQPPDTTLSWWGSCPAAATCPGPPIATVDDIVSCMGTMAREAMDKRLCLSFPRNGHADWPCPAP